MQDNQQNIQRYEEDEIDLRELFKTLWDNKIKIVLITTIITIAAIVYALTATKIYEAIAIVKIGEYKLNANANANGNGDGIVVTANASELVKELQVLYIDLLKNEKDMDAKVDKIDLVKSQKNLFEITVLGKSNESAIAELKKVVEYTQAKHKKILDDVKDIRESQIKQSEGRLTLLKTRTLPVLKDKISRYYSNIEIYETNFKDVQANLKKIRNSNPTLATMQINEQKYLADMLIKLRDSVERFESQRDNIEMLQIAKLEEDLNTLKSLMKPYNYRNTEVIGKIMTNDYAIKPKKRLIVVVAFVTGLILSIFLVFFLEFIRGFREEK